MEAGRRPVPRRLRAVDRLLRGRGGELRPRAEPRRHPLPAPGLGELCKIPYGTAISYAELARRIGQPSASRAVGGANGQNPISIIVPCHRVIGADGGLGGYGGGLDRKRWLLEHEAEVLARHPEWRSKPLAGSVALKLVGV